MKLQRLARIQVSTDLLRQALQLPEDIEIIGGGPLPDVVTLTVRSDRLALRETATDPLLITPVFRREECGHAVLDHIEGLHR